MKILILSYFKEKTLNGNKIFIPKSLDGIRGKRRAISGPFPLLFPMSEFKFKIKKQKIKKS